MAEIAAAIPEHAQVKRPAALDPPHGTGGDGRPDHVAEGCQGALGVLSVQESDVLASGTSWQPSATC